nr:MAG TPA: hypothetical protein [Caudoviricetes sp.]
MKIIIHKPNDEKEFIKKYSLLVVETIKHILSKNK